MKSPRHRLLLAALIVVGLLSVWWVVSRKTDDVPSKAAATAVSQTQNEAPATATVSQATSPPKLPPKNAYETIVERMESDYRTPIEFYGRVLDQHGLPVPDANVELSANDKWTGPPSKYNRKTDVKGAFSITGVHGLTLSARVSNIGYLEIPRPYGKVTSSGLFEYGLSSQGSYRSSKDNPTIFTLNKIGVLEPLVKIGEKNFRMARDGSPVSIAVDEQGAHQVIVRCWNQELQRPSGQRLYDWRLEVSVPNGGLLARKDAFAFEAPLYGYMPSDTIEMPASLANQWRSFAERSYFIRFEDGTFARAKLEMHAAGDHFVVWESFFNPKAGSPNLGSPPPDHSADR